MNHHFKLLECIKIILSSITNNFISNTETHIYTYQIIINYLYKRLIRSKFTNYSTNYYNNNLNNNLNHHNTNSIITIPFEFNNSSFNSFYHLLIKSPKLILHIMSLIHPNLFILNKRNYYLNDEEQCHFTLFLYPNIFTYEYIFKNNLNYHNEININDYNYYSIIDNDDEEQKHINEIIKKLESQFLIISYTQEEEEEEEEI